MRDVKNRTATAAKRSTPAPSPAPAAPHETYADALADLNRWLAGQNHQADAPLQLEALVQDINSVMDDELIAALDHVERHFVYSNDIADQDTLLAGVALRDLLDKLRNLQKARLRDAVARLVRRGEN